MLRVVRSVEICLVSQVSDCCSLIQLLHRADSESVRYVASYITCCYIGQTANQLGMKQVIFLVVKLGRQRIS